MSTFANIEDQDIMLHFIRVYTVCKGEIDLQPKNARFKKKMKNNLKPLDMYSILFQVYSITPLEGKIH